MKIQNILFCGILSAACLVYLPALRGALVYDDHWAIQRNPALALASPLLFWTDPATGADPQSGLTRDVYRPLTVSSFALSLRLWRQHLIFWHLENLFWHLLSGFLFILLLRRLGFHHRAGTLCAWTIFLLHPLQVSSVAWIYQRATVMSAAFGLAALYAALKPGPLSAGRWAWSLWCLAAALFSKESAVIFPFLYLILSSKQRRIDRMTYGAGAFFIVGSYLGIRAKLLGTWSQISDLPRGWTERINLTLVAIPQYAAKFFVPWGLRASYHLPTLTAWRWGLALGGILLIAIILYRMARLPGAGRFIAWLFIALAPMLPFMPIRAFFAERFFYLASFGAAALVGLWVDAHKEKILFVALWILILSSVTFSYATAWASDFTLWSWTVQREPTNAFAHLCLAETLRDPSAAKSEYQRALGCHPSPPMQIAAWNNLAALALTQQDAQQALLWTQRILRRQPQMPQALYNRWRALVMDGQNEKAEALKKELLKDPRIPARLLQN